MDLEVAHPPHDAQMIGVATRVSEAHHAGYATHGVPGEAFRRTFTRPISCGVDYDEERPSTTAW
jgi:hypothetical protein